MSRVAPGKTLPDTQSRRVLTIRHRSLPRVNRAGDSLEFPAKGICFCRSLTEVCKAEYSVHVHWPLSGPLSARERARNVRERKFNASQTVSQLRGACRGSG